MELTVKRLYLKSSYTVGKLYIDGKYECDTLEDRVRELKSEADKVYGETAIPYGRYQIAMNVISPKFSTYEFYRNVCQGRLPRLVDVPYFNGILIHVADGNKGAKLLSGCIGVGQNKIKGGLVNGKNTFTALYNKLEEAYNKGEQIWINVTR